MVAPLLLCSIFLELKMAQNFPPEALVAYLMYFLFFFYSFFLVFIFFFSLFFILFFSAVFTSLPFSICLVLFTIYAPKDSLIGSFTSLQCKKFSLHFLLEECSMKEKMEKERKQKTGVNISWFQHPTVNQTRSKSSNMRSTIFSSQIGQTSVLYE